VKQVLVHSETILLTGLGRLSALASEVVLVGWTKKQQFLDGEAG
jgi:hypothetical protein